MERIKLFLKGVCMGVSDVIPGVSGGTMALILGIYAELVNSIKGLHLKWLPAVWRWIRGGFQPEDRRDYADYDDDYAKRLVSGTIFEADLDTTHPLGYGFPDRELPVFRTGLVFLEPDDNPYETVARYTDQPLMAGYVSDERLDQVAGSAAVIANRVGEGLVVRLADNPNFRATWHGTARLMVNALYLSGAVGNTEMPR
jgi:hypothetical protein